MIFIRKLTLLLLLAPLCAPRAEQQLSLSPAAEQHLKKLEEPIVLRGDYFHAVQTAYDDFSRVLTKEQSEAKPPDAEAAELVRWSTKIDNYDIDVRQTKTAYVVHFGLTLRGNAPLILGGGARYEIEKGTFRIVEKQLLK